MPATASPSEAPVLSGALLRRFDVAGPRYTSYPTADRFVEAFGADDYRRGLAQHAEGAAIGGCPPLAERVLTVDDWADLDQAFGANRDPLTGHEAEADYRALFTRIVGLVPAPIGLGAASR